MFTQGIDTIGRYNVHRQTVNLRLPIADRCSFDGNIWFIYNNGEWHEAPVTREKETERAAHLQSIVSLADELKQAQ